MESLAVRQSVIDREISATPRDVARNISTKPDTKSTEVSANRYVRDPLKRTRKGRVEPLPISKNQRKKARQAEARRTGQQMKLVENI